MSQLSDLKVDDHPAQWSDSLSAMRLLHRRSVLVIPYSSRRTYDSRRGSFRRVSFDPATLFPLRSEVLDHRFLRCTGCRATQVQRSAAPTQTKLRFPAAL